MVFYEINSQKNVLNKKLFRSALKKKIYIYIYNLNPAFLQVAWLRHKHKN